MNQRINELAKQCWSHRVEGSLIDGQLHFDHKKFAELIVGECVDCCASQVDKRNIRKYFGLPVESNIKYPGEDPQGHNTQYGREYNIPRPNE